MSGLIRFGQLGLVLLALWLSACAGLSPPLEGTGQGAAEGAVSGVSLRAAAESDAATRVNLLAAVGAGDGNNWTRRMQGKLHAMQQATEGTGLQVVRTCLEDRGIKAERIEWFGRGSREPIAGSDTPEDRSRNRRIEILLREPRTTRN